jgi:secreted Zn-dependent insulinase-like peptidase
MVMVLNRFLKEPLFTELRTQQQIGYIVSLSQDAYGRCAGDMQQ